MIEEKALALIDGHHYMHVLRAALRHAEESLGYSVVGAVLLGGIGKLSSTASLAELEFPVMNASEDITRSIEEACDRFNPDTVIDLSGSPVLDLSLRLQIAGALVGAGISYVGSDFRFAPVSTPDLPVVPTLGVLGAGKRAGKTALCTFAARKIADSGMKPAVVTMARGGPVEPEILRGDLLEISPEFLLSETKRGRHAASDNYEEALFSKLPTVGCFRAGGGLAGSPFCTTVEKAVKLANSLDCDIQIYEGSGETTPPVRLDCSILVTSASLSPSLLHGPFGSCAARNADLIVVTGCEEPLATPEKVKETVEALRSANPNAKIRTAVFRPQPSGNIKGRRIVLATTAPQAIIETLTSYLEGTFNCKVSGVTTALADRRRLKEEMASLLAGADKPQVLLTELKAASVQVAVAMAVEAGLEIVFCNNIPQPAAPLGGDLEQDVIELAKLAVERYRARHPEGTED